MKNKWWSDSSYERQAAVDAKDTKKFSSVLKAVYRPLLRGTTHLFDLKGGMQIKEPAIITERWVQH